MNSAINNLNQNHHSGVSEGCAFVASRNTGHAYDEDHGKPKFGRGIRHSVVVPLAAAEMASRNVKRKYEEERMEQPSSLQPTRTDSPNQNMKTTPETTMPYVREEPRLSVPAAASRGGVSKPFPQILHEMLENIEEEGMESVVSWQPHGRCFAVHNTKTFVDVVMPKYFRQTKFASFQRQLNLYGFSRCSIGKDKGSYYHRLFLRGKPYLCHRMLRVKIKGTKVRQAASPDREPNFYAMPPMEAAVASKAKSQPSNITVLIVNQTNGDSNKIAFQTTSGIQAATDAIAAAAASSSAPPAQTQLEQAQPPVPVSPATSPLPSPVSLPHQVLTLDSLPTMNASEVLVLPPASDQGAGSEMLGNYLDAIIKGNIEENDTPSEESQPEQPVPVPMSPESTCQSPPLSLTESSWTLNEMAPSDESVTPVCAASSDESFCPEPLLGGDTDMARLLDVFLQDGGDGTEGFHDQGTPDCHEVPDSIMGDLLL